MANHLHYDERKDEHCDFLYYAPTHNYDEEEGDEDDGKATTEVPENVTHVRVVVGLSDDDSFTGSTNGRGVNRGFICCGIPNLAFANQQQLVEVQLPLYLTFIGARAFLHCTALTTIIIPPTVQAIGNEAFHSCSSLLEVEFSEGNLVQIGVAAFSQCRSLRSIQFPQTVQLIGHSAFCQCTSLESVGLSDQLQKISAHCFEFCSSLATVQVPPFVESIDKYAFHGCSQLRLLQLEEGLQLIDRSALDDCLSLTAIRIPSTVYRIGAGAFAGCRELVTVEIDPRTMLLHKQVFRNCRNLLNICFPPLPSINFTACFTFPTQHNMLRGCSKLSSLSSLKTHSRSGYDYVDLVQKMRERFDNERTMAVHKECYYQVYDPLDTAIQNLIYAILETKGKSVDCLGMNPYHILALSTRPHLFFFQTIECYQPKGGKDEGWTMHCQDATGSTPLDHLLQNNAPEAPESIQYVMQVIFQKRIQSLGLVKWQQEIQDGIDQVLALAATDVREARRPERCRSLYQWLVSKLELLERKESLSLLEMALWRFKIREVSSALEESKAAVPVVDRLGCRVNCGAGIVIANVLPFLGKMPVLPPQPS